MYGGFVVAGSSDFTEAVKMHRKDAEVAALADRLTGNFLPNLPTTR